MNYTIVLIHISDTDTLGWSGLVHNVDINPLLTLALSILHRDLVFTRLFSGRIDQIQLNSVSVDSEVSILTHLENLAVRTFNNYFQLRLLFSLNLGKYYWIYDDDICIY